MRYILVIGAKGFCFYFKIEVSTISSKNKGWKKMHQITVDEFQYVLAQHQTWLQTKKKKGAQLKAINTDFQCHIDKLLDCDLSHAQFKNCNLSYVTLHRCVLKNTQFLNCNLFGTSFMTCTFQKSRLTKSELLFTKFIGCQFQKTTLLDCNIELLKDSFQQQFHPFDDRFDELCFSLAKGTFDINEMTLDSQSASSHFLINVDVGDNAKHPVAHLILELLLDETNHFIK